MPYPNFHSARVRDPKSFQPDSMRTIAISAEKGITAIVGRLKEAKTTTIQAYRFEKKLFTVAEAKAWLKRKRIKVISFEQAIQAGFKLLCFQYRLSEDKILEMIPADILTNIKKKDSHPYFRAYVLAHEGESSPRVIGEGGVKISWTRKAIQSMKSFIKRGIKFFKGHNEDNSTKNRASLGEVVASKEIEIDGKLSNVVVGYFPEQNKEIVKKNNVISMEAYWSLIKKSGKVIADKMLKLTGIAMGNSNIERPAFKGSKLIGAVQAFENNDKENKRSMENITFADVKRAVHDMNIFPHQLYEPEKLKNDNMVKDLLKEKDSEITKLKEELETRTKESEKIQKQFQELETNQLKFTAEKRYKKLIEESGKELTDKEKSFVEKMSGKISDYTDDGIKSHFESVRAIYKENVAPLFEDTTDTKIDTGIDNFNEKNPFLPDEEE